MEVEIDGKYYEDWYSQKYILSVPEGNTEWDTKKMIWSQDPSRPSQSLVGIGIYKKLSQTKNKIGEYIDQTDRWGGAGWNKWVKVTNPFEKISQFSGLHNSISRAFFKLHEILYLFPLPKIEKTLSLCEAPGGFIQAILYRYPQVTWWAQTLYDGDIKIDNGLDPNRWIKNGNGDILIKENLITMLDILPDRMDLITGDGGFDVSHDPNNQEQLSFHLIFAECVYALHLQAIGGMFVCKLFTTCTRPTFQLIAFMRKFYRRLFLVKPRTSRFTNSEKYMVCSGFKGCDGETLYNLRNILGEWKHDSYCRDFGITGDIPPTILEYNNNLAKEQTWYIEEALKWYGHDFKEKHPKTKELEVIQNRRAIEFCRAFGIRKDVNPYCRHDVFVPTTSKKDINLCKRCLRLFK